jgi:chromosome segregation ATPase
MTRVKIDGKIYDVTTEIETIIEKLVDKILTLESGENDEKISTLERDIAYLETEVKRLERDMDELNTELKEVKEKCQ